MTTQPIEPAKLKKTGRRSWQTPDGAVEVYATVSSRPPMIRGLDNVKITHYRAEVAGDDGRRVEIAHATAYHDIRCRIARYLAERAATKETT